MAPIRCDRKGRLYLKEGVRSRYGSRFVLLQTPREIVLIPVPTDPLKDLGKLGRTLEPLSIKEIKERILQRAKTEALQ